MGSTVSHRARSCVTAKQPKSAKVKKISKDHTRSKYIRRLGIHGDKGGHRALHAPSIYCKTSSSSSSETSEEDVASDMAESTKVESMDIIASDKENLDQNIVQSNPLSRADLSSHDTFRISFLRKLSYEKVWVPKAQRPHSHQSVIIFDWDDTLFCTTFLTGALGALITTPAVEEVLRKISKAVQQLLEMSLRMGRTFIITNAESMWVEYTAANFLPDLVPTLQKVEVISARNRHQAEFPGDIGKWKPQAFLDVQRRFDSDIITNLISIGDSEFEMDAAHIMGNKFTEVLVKTVKFHEKPYPHELLTQLEILLVKFECIVGSSRSLTLAFSRTDERAVGA